MAQDTVSWEEFATRHAREKIADLAKSTKDDYRIAFGHFYRIITPQTLADLNGNSMSKFQAALREGVGLENPLDPATIRLYCGKLIAGQRWAADIGIAEEVKFPRGPKVQHKMRGRPLTDVEFLLLKHCTISKRWRRFLEGLWLSGLRVSEAVNLTWDTGTGFSIDYSGKHPCYHILQGCDKNKKAKLSPMTPDFAAFLGTPKTGRVFQVTRSPKRASERIAEFGRRAGIVTETVPEVRYATAHDLRRTFGTRWAKKVTPAVLKELMRHSSIKIAERYYLSFRAEEISELIWGKT